MKRTWRRFRAIIAICAALSVGGFLAGCSDENPVAPVPGTGEEDLPTLLEKTDPAPPSDMVTVAFGGEDLTFWPYVGASIGNPPTDPVNLIFVGQADPVRIRAALLALDGDRTAFGYPDVAPFNAKWSDAIGDVQATYAEGAGWTGSVIQLQLGSYDPVRWHLRLFRTGKAHGGGEWTIAAAHFEVLIPGTADHQVLTWEGAEQIVIADMIRTGLLDPALPMMPTGVINQQPSFREIPAMIYNGIPDELKAYVGGPLGQVTEPVGIPTDGKAMILNVKTRATVTPGTATSAFTMTYQQVVPKVSVMPLCDYGPLAYVLLTGPVRFEKTVTVGVRGNLCFEESYQGTLNVTPWDIAMNQPAGETYSAEVRGLHSGFDRGGRFSVTAFDSRRGRAHGRLEQYTTRLKVAVPGNDCYQVWTRCLD